MCQGWEDPLSTTLFFKYNLNVFINTRDDGNI